MSGQPQTKFAQYSSNSAVITHLNVCTDTNSAKTSWTASPGSQHSAHICLTSHWGDDHFHQHAPWEGWACGRHTSVRQSLPRPEGMRHSLGNLIGQGVKNAVVAETVKCNIHHIYSATPKGMVLDLYLAPELALWMVNLKPYERQIIFLVPISLPKHKLASYGV